MYLRIISTRFRGNVVYVHADTPLAITLLINNECSRHLIGAHLSNNFIILHNNIIYVKW